MPYKQVTYECVFCNSTYTNYETAVSCENEHLKMFAPNNFYPLDHIKIYNMIESRNAEPCDYCKRAYYVYGCEQECKYRNMGKCQIYGLGKGSKFSPKAEDIVKKFVVYKEEKENLNDVGIKW